MVSSAAQRLPGTGLPSGTTPKVLDRLRAAIRARHYSLRTEEAYVGWVRRFILFHKRRQRTKGSSHNVARSGQGTAS
jgi:Phage integrase, N-terminal SAM-like domain